MRFVVRYLLRRTTDFRLYSQAVGLEREAEFLQGKVNHRHADPYGMDWHRLLLERQDMFSAVADEAERRNLDGRHALRYLCLYVSEPS